jgi:hypothetical protein
MTGRVDDLDRVPVYITQVQGQQARCMPGGMPGRLQAWVALSEFPEQIAAGVQPGSVFFARVNLDAQTSEELVIADIEPSWGTVGPLHFDESSR